LEIGHKLGHLESVELADEQGVWLSSPILQNWKTSEMLESLNYLFCLQYNLRYLSKVAMVATILIIVINHALRQFLLLYELDVLEAW
jgi:hypothetical protein